MARDLQALHSSVYRELHSVLYEEVLVELQLTVDQKNKIDQIIDDYAYSIALTTNALATNSSVSYEEYLNRIISIFHSVLLNRDFLKKTRTTIIEKLAERSVTNIGDSNVSEPDLDDNPEANSDTNLDVSSDFDTEFEPDYTDKDYHDYYDNFASDSDPDLKGDYEMIDVIDETTTLDDIITWENDFINEYDIIDAIGNYDYNIDYDSLFAQDNEYDYEDYFDITDYSILEDELDADGNPPIVEDIDEDTVDADIAEENIIDDNQLPLFIFDNNEDLKLYDPDFDDSSEDFEEEDDNDFSL